MNPDDELLSKTNKIRIKIIEIVRQNFSYNSFPNP